MMGEFETPGLNENAKDRELKCFGFIFSSRRFDYGIDFSPELGFNTKLGNEFKLSGAHFTGLA